jgi:hypothetical protein
MLTIGAPLDVGHQVVDDEVIGKWNNDGAPGAYSVGRLLARRCGANA